MIFKKDINPKNSLYFIGGLILEELEKNEKNEIEFLDIYESLKEDKDISLKLFVLAVDWLFLLDALKLNQRGKLEKCF